MKPWILLVLGLALHLSLTLTAAWRETPTVDEYAHVPAGLAYWQRGTWSLYAKNPPLIKLWMTLPLLATDVRAPSVAVEPYGWGPWLYGTAFERENMPHYLALFFAARVMIVLLAAATGGLIYVWSRRFVDQGPAALAALGFWCAPTVLAHAHVATIDIGETFLVTLLCWRLAEWSAAPRAREVVLTGIVFGLCLGAKFTSVLLLPYVLWVALKRTTRWRTLAQVTIASWIALLAIYGFSAPGAWIGELNLHAASARAAASLLPNWFYIPLPRAFVEGFAAQLGDAERGEAGNYLFGAWSAAGWWYYNLVALALKEHVVTLALLLAAPFTARRGFARVWLPLICLAVPLLFFNPLQVGVRYLLPTFPFLFILLARVIKTLPRRARVAISIAWIATADLAAPNTLAYFNFGARALGAPKDFLLDSNYDWGQDLYRLRGLNAAAHGPIGLAYFGHVAPAHYGLEFFVVPDHPVPGLLAVSANLLEGMAYPVPSPGGELVFIGRDHYRWLRDLEPIRVEGSIFIFDTRNQK